MLNRERLLNTNMCDLLNQCNEYLLNKRDTCCIIGLLENKSLQSTYCADRCVQNNGECEDCIQEWLNSEERVNV